MLHRIALPHAWVTHNGSMAHAEISPGLLAASPAAADSRAMEARGDNIRRFSRRVPGLPKTRIMWLLVAALWFTGCGSSTSVAQVKSVEGGVVCLQPTDGTRAECFPAVEQATAAGQIAGKPVSFYRPGMCVKTKAVSDGPWAVVLNETRCPAGVGADDTGPHATSG